MAGPGDRLPSEQVITMAGMRSYSRGGVEALAEAFRPYLAEPLVTEGLGKIRSKFQTVEHVGPKWVADFLEIVDPADRAIRIRDAYETVSRLLDLLGIDPWDEPRA